MSYEELNDILGQGFYDGSYSSQKKANNLKYELKKIIRRNAVCGLSGYTE